MMVATRMFASGTGLTSRIGRRMASEAIEERPSESGWLWGALAGKQPAGDRHRDSTCPRNHEVPSRITAGRSKL